MLRILQQCFTKKTVKEKSETPSSVELNKRRQNIRIILQKIGEKGKMQRMVVREYIKRLYDKQMKILNKKRAIKLKKTADKLAVDEKFSPNGFVSKNLFKE